MDRRFVTLALAPILIALAGCSTTGGSSAVTGFAARPDNNQPIAAAIVDAMAGGLIGNSFGSNLDDGDLRRALEAEYRTLEYTPAGQPVTWGTRFSGIRGEVIAGAPYRVGSQNCRQYTHTVFSGGETQAARGTACRNDNGSWTPLV